MEAAFGHGLLGEVDEMSLQDLLLEARNIITPDLAQRTHHPPPLPFPPGHELFPLAAIVARHFRSKQSPTIAVSGPGSGALIGSLLGALVAGGTFAVLLVDPWHRFDATALVGVREGGEEMEHVHVLRPPRPFAQWPRDGLVGDDGDDDDDDEGERSLGELTAQAREWLAYAAHGSRHREFWGTILLGGPGGPDGGGGGGGGGVVRADVVCGWKGWLRVERPRLDGFTVGTSAEEALARREARQKVVDSAGWKVMCAWGEFYIWRS